MYMCTLKFHCSPAMLRKKLGATPTVSDRLLSLSPAARKLASRTATPITDHALRASYTPSRSHSRTGTPHKATPSRALATPTNASSTPSLTDNLLKLSN